MINHIALFLFQGVHFSFPMEFETEAGIFRWDGSPDPSFPNSDSGRVRRPILLMFSIILNLPCKLLLSSEN
jgi:hypothetical protein